MFLQVDPSPTIVPQFGISGFGIILFAFVLVVCIYFFMKRRNPGFTPDEQWLENE